jgi:zinc finger SWIM domain-containing protein 3
LQLTIDIITGSTVEVFVDSSETLTGIFFQDAEMQSNFRSFPEVVMVDATYKLTNLRMPVYLMLCIDGNGQSEIVACCVTSLETEDGMTAMANAFKKHNSRWDQVAMVMTDKDMTERTVFERAFPNATMHLCLFHVFRSFRRQITCEKFGVRRARPGVGHDVSADLRQVDTRLHYNLCRTVGVRLGIGDPLLQQQLAFVQGRVGGRPERPGLLLG